MAFLSPLFLAGVLAAAIPVVIHLLKRQPDAFVRFSAVKLLRHAPVEHASRRQLRELLLLALRVAALLLLALAFARPFLTSGAAAIAQGTTVVALDTSMSLSAPGQFERAREMAADAVAQADRGLVAVVTFSDVTQVVSQPSADRAMATAAIRAAQPGAGSASYRSALTTSADLLGGRPGTIVVVTDLQENGWGKGDRAAVPESARIDVRDVGAPPADLAVTASRVSGDRIVATVHNTGPASRPVRVSLHADDRVPAADGGARAGEVTIPVGANQSADVTFPVPRARWASISVEDSQGAAADNTRFLILDPTAHAKVLVITSTGDLAREAFYLEHALVASGSSGRAFDVEGVSGMALQSWDQARVDSHAAVVVLSTRGFEHHGREMLAEYFRKGGGVLVAAGADVDGDVVTEALGGLRITIVAPGTADATVARSMTPVDARHPVFQPFVGRSSLGPVTFRRVAAVRAEGCATVARFTTGETAVADCEAGAGRALVLASDLDNRWNDFPRHATFVPFVQEALRYVSGGSRSSEFIVGRAPAGVPSIPGVALLAHAGLGAPGIVAVNVDPAESTAGRLTTAEFETAVVRTGDAAPDETKTAAAEQEERQHIWQYLLALMVVTLIVESMVAMRTA